MRLVVVLGSFLVIYQLGAEIINYVAVYGLEMVDSKFGDAEGNFEVGRQALPWLTAVATVSFAAGIWPHRTWFAIASAGVLIMATATSALICNTASLSGLYLIDRLPEPISGELWPIGWLVVFGLPMLCGRKLFVFIRPPQAAIRNHNELKSL